jgi:hypothetical protein
VRQETGILAVVRRCFHDNASLFGVIFLIAAACVLGALLTDRFLSVGNMLNVYEQSTDLALVSIGQTLTILSGGIDLSVGSLISLTSFLTSGLINGDPERIVPVAAAFWRSERLSVLLTLTRRRFTRASADCDIGNGRHPAGNDPVLCHGTRRQGSAQFQLSCLWTCCRPAAGCHDRRHALHPGRIASQICRFGAPDLCRRRRW